jgi:threonine aldolase
MAAFLGSKLREFKGIQITQPIQVNGVFAIFPPGIAEQLQEKFPFYVWNEDTNEVRLMASWDTTEADILTFIDYLKEILPFE